MKPWKLIIAGLGASALVAAMIFNLLNTTEFLAASGLWLAIFALSLADITEINLGTIVGIKRDVQAAREIREQVEQHAEQIRAIRDQVGATEERVNAQARSISVTSEKVAQSRADVMKTQHILQQLAARMFEAMLLLEAVREAKGITEIPSDHPLLLWWARNLEEVRKLSGMSSEEVEDFVDELYGLLDLMAEQHSMAIRRMREERRGSERQPDG